MSKIFLWTDGVGWGQFDSHDKEELAKRNIIVGNGVRIGNCVRIGNDVRIGDLVRIGHWAKIGDGVSIGNGISIGNGVSIGNGARIGDLVRIGNGATISHEATIGDGVEPKIFYLVGTRHPVSYWGEDRIDIGCEVHTIAEWLERFQEIGNCHRYTAEQIQEYESYIRFIAAVHGGK